MKTKPIFSVIIPAHNEEKFLSHCLRSILNQDFPKDKYEIIVVNNASTDKTPQIAKKFRVKLIQEARKGVIQARKKGLEKAKGKFIANIDADSIVPKNWLSRIYNHLRKNNFTAITGPLAPLEEKNWKTSLLFSVNNNLNYYYSLISKNPFEVFSGNVAFRKKTLLKSGGYNPRLPNFMDQKDLSRKLKKQGKILFDRQLVIKTSDRRAKGRMLKFIFKEGFFIYFFSPYYYKVTKKSLGDWQDIR